MTLTKKHALAIAKKLNATIDKKGSGHDRAEIFHEGKLIAHFGIRRGSRKDQSHGHIPADLYVTQKDARDLALCPMTKKEWLELMEEKGFLA